MSATQISAIVPDMLRLNKIEFFHIKIRICLKNSATFRFWLLDAYDGCGVTTCTSFPIEISNKITKLKFPKRFFNKFLYVIYFVTFLLAPSDKFIHRFVDFPVVWNIKKNEDMADLNLWKLKL